MITFLNKECNWTKKVEIMSGEGDKATSRGINDCDVKHAF